MIRALAVLAIAGFCLMFGFAAPTETPVSAAAMDHLRTGAYATKRPAGTSIRVLSWNIDRGSELDRVAALVQSRAADLCLFQEVDLHTGRSRNVDQAEHLARKLGDDYAFGTAWEEMGQRVNGRPAYQGQATLSRWPIVASRVLRFERQSGWWKPHWFIPNTGFFQRRHGGRIALVTEISINGTRTVVYNIHLESRSGGAIQTVQLHEILADLSHYPPGTPAMIGGDFNSKYHPVALRHFMEKQGFQSVLGPRLVRTHVLIGFLDWIFYRGDWTIEQAEVIRGTHASDHDPIFAELAAKGASRHAAGGDPAEAPAR